MLIVQQNITNLRYLIVSRYIFIRSTATANIVVSRHMWVLSETLDTSHGPNPLDIIHNLITA